MFSHNPLWIIKEKKSYLITIQSKSSGFGLGKIWKRTGLREKIICFGHDEVKVPMGHPDEAVRYLGRGYRLDVKIKCVQYTHGKWNHRGGVIQANLLHEKSRFHPSPPAQKQHVRCGWKNNHQQRILRENSQQCKRRNRSAWYQEDRSREIV